MAVKGTNQTITIDGIIYNADAASIAANFGVAEVDSTNVASTASEFTAMIPDATIDVSGYWHRESATAFSEALNSALETPTGVTYQPDRTLSADATAPGYFFLSSFVTSQPISSPTDGLITIDGTFRAGGEFWRGFMLESNRSFTGAGAGAGVDIGGAFTGNHVFVIAVHSIDGSTTGTATNARIDIQDSTDNISFGPWGNVADITAPGLYVRPTVIPTTLLLDRYVQWKVQDMGGATSIEASIIVAVDGLTF